MPAASPPPPGPSDAVSAAGFASDLRRRVLGERFRHVKALAAQTDALGVGRSTIYSALAGRRLPSEYTLRRLLDVAAGADEQEIRRWVTARAAIESLTRVAAPGTPSPADPADTEPNAARAEAPASVTPSTADRGPEPGTQARRPFVRRDRGRADGPRWQSRAGWAAGGAAGAVVVLTGLFHLVAVAGPVAATPADTLGTTLSAPTTPGVHCTYRITDPGGAEVRQFPAPDAVTYGPRRPTGQMVQSRYACASATDENAVTHRNTRWVQVIVGTPGSNVNGWMNDTQLDAVAAY